jgi:hypothetical protein
MGQMHQFIRETVILNWNEKSYTKPVMTFHLVFITWGTLLLEYPSYVFRNKEGELQESAADL